MSDYELLKKIAEGGMGEVFVARRRGVGSFDKHVALKLMLPHLSQDAERRARFLQEARVAALMHHPNVVEIFDVGEREGRPFLAMQLVEGVTLSVVRRAAPGGQFPLELARLIGLGLCEGLAYVHELADRKGQPLHLVHRDVSPGNVLVSQAGAVLLTDFGIARARDSESLTRPGMMRGKPAWVAPEQLAANQADARADQYSAALVLYELISGEHPFRTDDPKNPRDRVSTKVASLASLRADVGPKMSQALARALSLDPERRFPTIREFSAAFLDGPVGTAPALGVLVREKCGERLRVLDVADEGPGTGTLDPKGKDETPSLVFGKYQVVQRLAAGGMGEVLLAQQGGLPGFEREVILKSLLPERAGDADAIDEFLDEARVLATLNHPNLVSLYDVGTWNGTHFLAMEFIRGKTVGEVLRDLGERGETVPPVVAAAIIRDAALGLAHAHAARDPKGRPLHIVHRDVSPQNIMVRFDGLTKVVDFGIATSKTRQAGATAPGWVKGKLAYMSPEQLLGSELTPFVDQYALGIVLWELLAMKRLFGNTAEHRLERVASPAEGKPEVPAGLAAIAVRMLDPDPPKRFPSCEAVARALDAFVAEEGAEARHAVADFMAQWAERSAVPTQPVSPISAPQVKSKVSETRISSREGLRPVTTGAKSVRREAPANDTRLSPLDVDEPPTDPRRDAPEPAVDATSASKRKVSARSSVVTDPDRPSAKRLSRVSEEPGAPVTPKWPWVVGAVLLVSVLIPATLLVQRSLGSSVTTVVDAGVRVASPRVVPDASVPVAVAVAVPVEVAVDAGAPVVVEAPVIDAGVKHGVTSKRPKPTVAEQGRGALSIDTRPWSRVTVDGVSWGSTPIIERGLSAGSHVVTLEAEGRAAVTKQVTVTAEETFKLTLELK